MKKINWNVAIFGTFDVMNYGDLLFPIIAEAELASRMSMINVHPYSYYSKSVPEWPYKVNSVADFPEVVTNFDGILIGGGHIIRFDKQVAPGYRPPNQSIHHPTGYWLTPSLVGLQHDVPVIWNAPGFYDVVPTWAKPLLKLSLNLSSYVSVRDEHSAKAMLQIDESVHISILPDTAFTVSKLVNQEKYTNEFIELKQKYCLTKPYIIVQATSRGLEFFLRLIKKNRSAFNDYLFIVITIGPAVGDDLNFVNLDLPEIIKLPFLANPLLVAELICHSEGVVGSSYHLAITALAFGIPVFSTIDTSQSKLTPLLKYERIYTLPLEGDIYAPWFIKKLGGKVLSPLVLEAQELLNSHWDRIVKIIMKNEVSTSRALNKFWFSLPILLEKNEVTVDLYQDQLKELKASLSSSQNAIKIMQKSLSFKITKPLRQVKRFFWNKRND